ncbi:hypothetical protein K227x_64370 [Rubripirellula lacrimiformis]|uniref:Uncharacterized protein n=1 Tax=Rubripirellula lacrimiformis TaxID=1930273 RepID=A0A517NLJ0_9BACT|nr:hypothetical protein K227x_64370 [Rubripirellula lacrimiformis]
MVATDDSSVDHGCSKIFADRDAALHMLGFDCYSDYLTSDLWIWVRSNLKDPKVCISCTSSSGLAWHHRRYDLPTLVGNFSTDDSSIVRVCNRCHSTIHREEETWFDLDQVDARLSALMEHCMNGATGEPHLPGIPENPFEGLAEFDPSGT